MQLAKPILIACLFIPAIAGCKANIAEDEECRVMREIGRSDDKSAEIRDWIESILGTPRKIAAVGRAKGNYIGLNDDLGFDWDFLGIPRERGMIELYGASVNYRDLKRSSVEAVVVGYGNGYKLIFKLQPNSDIESKLAEGSRKPYGEIKMESLHSDVVLVCQVNNFG